MADTPSSTPNDPAGESPEQSGREPLVAQHGQHESHDPQSPGAGAGHGRHEMAGPAGYPQFEGPGAAQYGSEPVEPPPPVTPAPGAPQHPHLPAPPQPTYGPAGTGPAGPPQGTMPPPPGGMPPPPGTMPPPGAPQQTYGYQADSSAARLDVGNALSYGWEKFRSNPVPWLGVTGLGVVIYLVFVLLVRIVNPTSLLPLMLIFLVVMVGIWLLQAALVRGALYETDGYKPVFGSYFHFVDAGNVLLTALLAFVLTAIGWALFVVPGFIAGFLCMFALHYVIDQDQGPFEAIKSSATLVVINLVQVLLLALAVVVITFVGALLCGLGLLIAAPLTTIAVTYAYRTLTGGAAL